MWQRRGSTATNQVPRIADLASSRILLYHRLRLDRPPGFLADFAPPSCLDGFIERCWSFDWVIDLDIQEFLNAWSHCSFVHCGWSEQPVLGGWWFDTQAFPASGADVDGVE